MDEGEERRVGGRMKVRIMLSALEVRRLVPSGVLGAINALILCRRGGEMYHCALLK